VYHTNVTLDKSAFFLTKQAGTVVSLLCLQLCLPV